MKVDNKKNIALFVLSILCIAIILIGLFVREKTDIRDFKKEYEAYNGQQAGDYKYFDLDIKLNNKITYIKEKDLLKAMNEETAVFYFGFPTCPWCRNVVEPLLKVAKDENVKVYYFNPRDIRTNDSDTYKQLLKKVDKYLSKNEDGEKVLYVPDIYFIKDGKIVGNHLGSLDSQENPYVKLNAEQTKELESIFLKMINKMK